MAPDLNSLPPSRSSSTSSSLPRRSIPPASPATATAGVNTSAASPWPPRGPSMGRLSVSERRRSSAAGMPPSLVESPSTTSSGYNGETPGSAHRASLGHAIRTTSPNSHGSSPIFATADPHHQRAPSLGELHQELEQEQEAQVNRLLQMIRSQQAQLQQLQQQNREQNPQSATAIIDDTTTPSSEPSSSFFPPIPPPATSSSRLSISSPSNRRSRASSQTTSPNLPPQDASRAFESTEAFAALREGTSRRGSRDESAYYQAEAAMLSRENQMLRQRIRELERQIADMNTAARPSASTATASAETSGQEGPEPVDPRVVPPSDAKI